MTKKRTKPPIDQIDAARSLYRAYLTHLHVLAEKRDQLMRQRQGPAAIQEAGAQVSEQRASVSAARKALGTLLAKG